MDTSLFINALHLKETWIVRQLLPWLRPGQQVPVDLSNVIGNNNNNNNNNWALPSQGLAMGDSQAGPPTGGGQLVSRGQTAFSPTALID